MAQYYTRHQSLKHIWYQRYNSRSSSRNDGVVPWHAKECYKSDAWRVGCAEAWNQLMQEREQLYNDNNIAQAQVLDIEYTKSGSIKLWINIENPYAEKWDFGDVNTVTIRKNKMDDFQNIYGTPNVGLIITVTLEPYTRSGNYGYSYKINYNQEVIISETKSKIYDIKPNTIQKIEANCPACGEMIICNIDTSTQVSEYIIKCKECANELTVNPTIACSYCDNTFDSYDELLEHNKKYHPKDYKEYMEEQEANKNSSDIIIDETESVDSIPSENKIIHNINEGYCSKCGRKQKDDYKFCCYCGTQLI